MIMKKLILLYVIGLLSLGNVRAQEANNDVYFELGKNSKGADFYGLKKNGKWIVPPTYLSHGSFQKLSNDLALVQTYDGYGFIDKSGKLVIPCRYGYAENFIGPYALVSYNKRIDYYDDDEEFYTEARYFYIDKKGSEINDVKASFYNNNKLRNRGREINGKRFGEWVFVNLLNSSIGNFYRFSTETYNSQSILEGYFSEYFYEADSYSINPKLNFTGSYKNGKKHGDFTYYSPEGTPQFVEIWENGTFKKLKNIYNRQTNSVSAEGTGEAVVYNEFGLLSIKTNYEKGHRSGITEWYHKNGKLKQKVLYKRNPDDPEGLRWEILEVNDKNGNPLPKGTLKNGNGTIINYDENGKPLKTITYQNGKKVKEETALAKDIDKIYENILPKDNNNKIIAEGTSAERAIGNHSYETSKGLYEYSTGEYTAALASFKTAAEKGEQEAMVYLGAMYYEGLGTTKDYKKAYEWILKAKNEGNAKASYQLGIMYYNGKGVAQSYAEAYKWYNVAAAKGVADADYNIGLLFEAGNGVEKNIQTAFNHFKRAADKGSLPGAYATGIYYYFGNAGEKNIPAALKYTLMAEKAFTKSPDYYNQLAYCYFESGELQMALNKLAVAMKIDPTYANGYDSMGEIYLKTGNKTLATEYYKKAAQMGHENAMKWCKQNNITY